MWMNLGMAKCRIPFMGHCDLGRWPSFRIIMFGAFFYIICARNLKFGVWLPLGMAECHVSVL